MSEGHREQIMTVEETELPLPPPRLSLTSPGPSSIVNSPLPSSSSTPVRSVAISKTNPLTPSSCTPVNSSGDFSSVLARPRTENLIIKGIIKIRGIC